VKIEARCNICNSVYRLKVDKLISRHYNCRVIAEKLMEMEREDEAKNRLPFNHVYFKDKTIEAVRKNVERHAKRHLSNETIEMSETYRDTLRENIKVVPSQQRITNWDLAKYMAELFTTREEEKWQLED
jgi:hypothetical protein